MIILVGIPGCGKTSILKEAKRVIPHLQVVNYGDKMLEVASLQKCNRDLLRKMPVDNQKEIGLEAAKKIAEESNEATIVDTHALIRTNIGYVPGLPKDVLTILSPKAYAIIECAPSKIIQRRIHDSSDRKRDIESEEELALHQELSRSYLSACSLLTGSLICRINNDTDSIERNTLPLVQLIHDFTQLPNG